jgi:PAS domain S-box-containing protein
MFISKIGRDPHPRRPSRRKEGPVRKSAEPRVERNSRRSKAAALLAAARAVLENRAFADAARAVLGKCKAILGADAGFLALRAAGGKGFEVALLDPAGAEGDDGGLPAPLRRLSVRASLGRAVFANDLSRRPAQRPSSPGRLPMPESALLAPIVIAGDVAGLVGLINKPGGFSAADRRLAEAFADMAAVAMINSRTVSGLETEVRQSTTQRLLAEQTFRTLVDNLPDVIARFDAQGRYLYASPVIQQVTGRPARDFVGKTNRQMGISSELSEEWDQALRRVFASGRPERLEVSVPAPDGLRRFDCRLVAEPGPEGSIPSVLTVARDVTDRWLAHEAERRARAVADSLREATVALTRSLDRETVLATLLDRLRGMVPFDRASVMLVEAASRVSVRAVFDGERVVPLPAEKRPEFDPTDHPIVHGILTTGAAVLIPDLRARPDWSLPTDRACEASWMGVPLFARGDVAGLFSLSKREPGYFNEEHVRLAEAMSSQASVAVENAVLFEQMQASTLRMQSLSRRLVEAHESERRNIARELHDEAGQALASLRIGLRLLEREIDEGGSVGERVAELMQRTDAVIDGLHRLAADLRPASLDHLGLEAALRQFSRSAAAKFGLTVHFKARGFDSGRLPPAMETALYRVVQEAMTNVVRHARATQVDVLVERRDDRVVVMVEDDGVGFEPDRVERRDHFGLLGLRERAEALGGTLTLESAPGAGTTVVVEVPSADPHRDR